MGMMNFVDGHAPEYRLWPGFDCCRGPGGGYREWINSGMIGPALDLLAAPHPDSLEPGSDDVPVPLDSLRATGGGMPRHYLHTDYMIDDPVGLDPDSNVLCRFLGDDAPRKGMPLPDVLNGVFVKGMGSGLGMNAVFMFHDFITLTDDPVRSIDLMGFSRAMRLSAISRARIGGMKALGVTRRRLFSMAVGHARRGDLDRFLLVAALAECGPGGLEKEIDGYEGLPDGFVLETLHASRHAGVS